MREQHRIVGIIVHITSIVGLREEERKELMMMAMG